MNCTYSVCICTIFFCMCPVLHISKHRFYNNVAYILPFFKDGSHVISRIETHLSDGTTQISTSLTPETAQLLARLNPSMFPIGSLVQVKIHCNLVITLWLGSKAKSLLAKQPGCSQTKMYRIYRKMTIKCCIQTKNI